MPSRRGALGGAERFHDAIISDAFFRKKAPCAVDVFGGHAHPLAPPGAEGGGHVFKVGHGAHVDPGLRHSHNHVGVAKTQRREQRHVVFGIGKAFAHKVLAGDAKVRGAGGKLLHDLGGRQEGHFNAGDFAQHAAIIACAAPLHKVEARAGEKRERVLLQASLGGDGQHQRRGFAGLAHSAAPAFGSIRRSHQMAAPTAGISAPAPSARTSPS